MGLSDAWLICIQRSPRESESLHVSRYKQAPLRAVSVGGSAKDKRLEMSCSIILMNWKLETSQEAWSSAKS